MHVRPCVYMCEHVCIVYVCMCVCTCMCVVYMCVHVCILYVCMCVCTCMCVCVYVHVYVCVGAYYCIFMYVMQNCTCGHTYIWYNLLLNCQIIIINSIYLVSVITPNQMCRKNCHRNLTPQQHSLQKAVTNALL